MLQTKIVMFMLDEEVGPLFAIPQRRARWLTSDARPLLLAGVGADHVEYGAHEGTFLLWPKLQVPQAGRMLLRR